MKITLNMIKSLNPCKTGIDSFESKYPNYKGTLVDILSMEDVGYSDKIWLATKILDKMTLVQWSLDCALMVADNFNKEFPNDNRVNECLKAVKRYVDGEITESVRSAAESAWSAARSAAESARSAALSAAQSAAWSAAESARLAALSSEQEYINLSLLIALVDNLEE